MEHEDLSTGGVSEDLREYCGIFGTVASGEWPTNVDVAHMIYLGLIDLQHRGQESCGIITSLGDIDCVKRHKKAGLVSHAFTKDDIEKLKGNLGIGHTRYSTTGGTDDRNIQPFVDYSKHGILAVAHNGELVNAAELRREILERGVELSTESDSELLVKILCMPPPEPNNENNGPDWPARIQNLMRKTKTSYSLLIMNGETIYAVRDPYGNRPLCIGKLLPTRGSLVSNLNEDECEAYLVSSESCAFRSGAKLIRDVQPGEIVEITRHGFRSVCIMPRPEEHKKPAFCIFEYVYFARSDSVMEGQMVYTARMECGRQLARQAPVDADVVSGVPDSGTTAALGFAEESKIRYAEVFHKSRYVGRTFIQPTPCLREQAVQQKFGPLSENIEGKKIVLIDDSIVRGITIGTIISLLREAGALEVHIRVASPPVHHPCYMGINIPTKEELIANKLNPKALASKIGADSLVYLSVDNLKGAVMKHTKANGRPIGHCTACLTGEYPVELQW